jgi:hypothetical protein
MNLYQGTLVIFLAGLVGMLGAAWWTGREPRIPIDRLADPAPLPGEQAVYGPFPVDTGPLLIVSDSMAAIDRHTREVEELCRLAEERIGRLR